MGYRLSGVGASPVQSGFMELMRNLQPRCLPGLLVAHTLSPNKQLDLIWLHLAFAYFSGDHQ